MERNQKDCSMLLTNVNGCHLNVRSIHCLHVWMNIPWDENEHFSNPLYLYSHQNSINYTTPENKNPKFPVGLKKICQNPDEKCQNKKHVYKCKTICKFPEKYRIPWFTHECSNPYNDKISCHCLAVFDPCIITPQHWQSFVRNTTQWNRTKTKQQPK